MRNYGNFGKDNGPKANMIPVFVAMGIFVVISFIVMMKDIIGAMRLDISTSMLIFMAIPLLSLLLTSIAVFRVAKQWKEQKNRGPKVACGRGPNRGAESLPVGIGGKEDFFVKRVVSNGVSLDQTYHVLNAADTRILEAKLESGFGMWIVKNNDGECVGKIKHSGGITNLDHYEVQIGNEEPFIIQRILDAGVLRYDVDGLDYTVATYWNFTQFDVFDLYGNVVASMKSRRMEDGWMSRDECRVNLSPKVENNIYILFLMLCLFIEKEHKESKD